jgi:hypothetical protein
MAPDMKIEKADGEPREQEIPTTSLNEETLPSRESFLGGARRLLSNLNPFGEPSYHPGGPYFYASFSSYHFPPRPVSEMTLEETIEHAKSYSYYIAHFNNEGKIEQWSKFYPDGSSFCQKFAYENGVLRTAATEHSNGEKSVIEFDKHGKRIGNS